MIGTSLSAVAAFVAFTVYTIASDEIRANRSQKTGNAQPKKAPLTAIDLKAESETVAKKETKTKPVQKRTRKPKVEVLNDPIALASKAILEYVQTKGPVTLIKLSQELGIDNETVQLASDKLVAGNSLVSVKRGRYPGLAPI